MFLVQSAMQIAQCKKWKEEETCLNPAADACFNLFDFGSLGKLTSCENLIPEKLEFLDSLQCKKLSDSGRNYCAEAINAPWIMIICIIIVVLALVFGIWCCACCCCAKCCACCCCNKHHKGNSDVEATTLTQQPAIFSSPMDQ